jgi:alkylation response protein AidB-like acyl-CoA dehydrogenase
MKPTTYKVFKYLPSWLLQRFLSALSTPQMQSKLCTGTLKKQPVRDSQRALGISSAAKLACSNLAMENTALALGVLGAASFNEDNNDLFKVIRDSKLLQIYEGSNQLNALHVYKGLNSFHTPLFEDPLGEGHYA